MAKVYVLGGTGGIVAPLVRELLGKEVPTLFCSIAGHDRLFLLVHGIDDVPQIKATFAKIAYEAGVKQVVDISSGTAIFELPNRNSYVALRPACFFSNHFFGGHMTVKHKDAMFGPDDPEQKLSWISPNDIAHLAANILTEPLETHRDMVYDMTSARLSGNDSAAALSNALGKEIKYVQASLQEAHKNFMEHAKMPHRMIYAILDGSAAMPFPVTLGLATILHREPETLKQWFTLNKDSFV